MTESFDALVVGAGPTGLACGIELQQRGVKTVLIEKGCVVNSIYHYPTNMTFFTTPELLEIGNIPMTSLNEKPNRHEALKYYRRVAEHFIWTSASTSGWTGSRARTMPSRFHHRPAGVPARYTRRARSCWPRVTTTSPTAERARRRTGQGAALLQGAAPVLQPRRGGDRRQEFGGHRRAGAVLDRRARDADPSRRRHFRPGEVLDQAEYRKPHQERRDPGLFSFARGGDSAGFDPRGDARR